MAAGWRPATDRPGRLDGLNGLRDLVGPLAEAIKHDLGRAPDEGELLIVLTADSSALVSRALTELGMDRDALWATVERLRNERRDADVHLADQIAQVGVAKEQAIEKSSRARRRAARSRTPADRATTSLRCRAVRRNGSGPPAAWHPSCA